jgi:hypothetical protein
VCVLLMDAGAFSGENESEENPAEAYAQALSNAGARVQVLRPGDDIASALRSVWHAARPA